MSKNNLTVRTVYLYGIGEVEVYVKREVDIMITGLLNQAHSDDPEPEDNPGDEHRDTGPSSYKPTAKKQPKVMYKLRRRARP